MLFSLLFADIKNEGLNKCDANIAVKAAKEDRTNKQVQKHNR